MIAAVRQGPRQRPPCWPKLSGATRSTQSHGFHVAPRRETEMGDVPLLAKVNFLSDPASYPHRPSTVIAKETHWAWVFLAAGLVYKMKKPSLRPSMDFRELPARRWACENELKVNQRLAPSIYRSVVPLVLRDDGSLALGGDGEVVEWLVEMLRLDTANCMDARIADGRLTVADAEPSGIRSQSSMRAALPKRLPILAKPTSDTSGPKLARRTALFAAGPSMGTRPGFTTSSMISSSGWEWSKTKSVSARRRACWSMVMGTFALNTSVSELP